VDVAYGHASVLVCESVTYRNLWYVTGTEWQHKRAINTMHSHNYTSLYKIWIHLQMWCHVNASTYDDCSNMGPLALLRPEIYPPTHCNAHMFARHFMISPVVTPKSCRPAFYHLPNLHTTIACNTSWTYRHLLDAAATSLLQKCINLNFGWTIIPPMLSYTNHFS